VGRFRAPNARIASQIRFSTVRSETCGTRTTGRVQLADSTVGPIVGPNAAVPDRIGLDPINVCGIRFG
jgi:hypothetical protein